MRLFRHCPTVSKILMGATPPDLIGKDDAPSPRPGFYPLGAFGLRMMSFHRSLCTPSRASTPSCWTAHAARSRAIASAKTSSNSLRIPKCVSTTQKKVRAGSDGGSPFSLNVARQGIDGGMHQLGTIAVPIAEIAEDLVVLREELTGPELFPALVISSLAFQAHRTCGVLQGNA